MYLMRREAESEDDQLAARFRDDALLHSTFSQNPRLYHELYAEPDVPEDWEVPETLDDLQRMIAELSEIGVDLDAQEVVLPSQPDQAALEAQYGVRPPTQEHHR